MKLFKPIHPLPLLAALCAMLASPLASAQKFSPGLWEHQFTMKSESGRMEKAMREAQQAMASMTPEQRKMMQDMMASQGVAFGPQGNSVKVCITKEEAERDAPPPAQEGCTQTSKRNGNIWQLSFKCPGPLPSSGDGTVTVQSPTAYSGLFRIVTDLEGKPEKMNMNTSGKWLGANCGNILPVKP
jgi:hypothetical protein